MTSTEAKLADFPMVDISAAFDEVVGDRYRMMAEQLVYMLKTYGYVYLKTDAINKETVGELMAVANRFFQLPSDVKSKYQIGDSNFEGKNGYMGIDFERLDQKYGNVMECRESYNIFDLTVPLQTEADCPGMQQVCHDFFHRCKDLLMVILKAIAVGLKLEDENIFESMYKDAGTSGSLAMLRLLNYPPLSVGESQEVLRCGAHVDYEILTINFQDDAGGLEMMNRKTKTYEMTPNIDGTIIIQTGVALEKMTDGLFTGTLHRVRVIGDAGAGQRQSAAFFGHPDHNVRLRNLFRYHQIDDADDDSITALMNSRQLYEASFKK